MSVQEASRKIYEVAMQLLASDPNCLDAHRLVAVTDDIDIAGVKFAQHRIAKYNLARFIPADILEAIA